MFHRLNKAQMPLRQGQIATPGQGAQHLDAGFFHAKARQPLVTRAGNPVQDDTRKGQVRIVILEPQRGGRSRLRLTAHIDNQHNGPAHSLGRLGRRAKARLPARGNTVIKPHGTFADANFCACGLGRDRIQQTAVHRPGIKVEAGAFRGRQVKRRVDVIRPAFVGLHGQPVLCQRPQQAQHHGGLAGARRGRRDHQARRVQVGHGLSHRRGSSSTTGCPQSAGGSGGRSRWNRDSSRQSLRPSTPAPPE